MTELTEEQILEEMKKSMTATLAGMKRIYMAMPATMATLSMIQWRAALAEQQDPQKKKILADAFDEWEKARAQK